MILLHFSTNTDSLDLPCLFSLNTSRDQTHDRKCNQLLELTHTTLSGIAAISQAIGKWFCGSGRYIVQCVPNRLIASKDPIYINCITRFMLTTLHKRLSDEYPSMTAKVFICQTLESYAPRA
jgi:hypothetical protein